MIPNLDSQAIPRAEASNGSSSLTALISSSFLSAILWPGDLLNWTFSPWPGVWVLIFERLSQTSESDPAVPAY